MPIVPAGEGCLLVDARMPGMGGLELLQRLKGDGSRLPAIMITGQGDVPMAVEAMKAGAADFIEKPIRRDELLASIERALEQTRDSAKLSARREAAATRLAGLTARQRQIMDLVLAGHPSKNIAADLGISQRTVENHRAAVMKKTGSRSLSALIRLALAADPATCVASPRLTRSVGIKRLLAPVSFEPLNALGFLLWGGVAGIGNERAFCLATNAKGIRHCAVNQRRERPRLPERAAGSRGTAPGSGRDDQGSGSRIVCWAASICAWDLPRLSLPSI